MSDAPAKRPFKLRGSDGNTIQVPPGEFYFNTKACCRRMMLNSLTGPARQVYACVELHAKGYRREICVIKENGRIRRLTVSDIGGETKLDPGTVRRALRELEAAGLVERKAINPERPLIKGNVGIYCHAFPQAVKTPPIEGTRALNIPLWFPESDEEWKELKAFFRRNRIAVDPTQHRWPRPRQDEQATTRAFDHVAALGPDLGLDAGERNGG